MEKRDIKDVSDIIALDVIKYEVLRAVGMFSAVGWLEYADFYSESVIALLQADKNGQFKYGEMTDNDVIALSRIIVRNTLTNIGTRVWMKNPEYMHTTRDELEHAVSPSCLYEHVAHAKFLERTEYTLFCDKLKVYALEEGGDFAKFVLGLLEPPPDVVEAYKELHGFDISGMDFSEISFNKLAGVLSISRRKFVNVKKGLQKYLQILGCDSGLQGATGTASCYH